MPDNVSRRDFLRGSAASVGALSMAGAAGAWPWSRRRKPNIIFILTDDLGYGDLGCFGQTKIRTPSLDRMAAQGVRFTQAYSGSTVCAPSRCTLMTGLHTGHCRVRDNFPRTPLLPENLTVAEHLKSAGYATALMGKWGLGEPDTTGIPNRKGFDRFVGFLNQAVAHTYYPEHIWRNEEQVAPGAYTTDIFSADALQFIRENADNPFFLYLAYQTPHAALEVPEDSLAEYLDAPWAQSEGGKRNAAYAAMITRMDADIGRMFALLAELGIDEDTIVFFTSDNGPSLEGGQEGVFDSNGPYRGSKRDLYEGGIRVPTIVRWPGKVAPGTESDQPWAFWDFFPTAADIAGAPLPAGCALDGISVLPAILGKRQKQQHEYLYWEWKGQMAARAGNWKAVWRNRDEEMELYNLSVDPAEEHNVAAANGAVVGRMVSVMTEAHTTSDVWPLPEEG